MFDAVDVEGVVVCATGFDVFFQEERAVAGVVERPVAHVDAGADEVFGGEGDDPVA